MRTRIKSIQVNGQTKAVREWKTFWGVNNAVLAASETPKHAKSCVRKVMAYKRTQGVTASDLERHAQQQRKSAFLAMPRREYKQVYIH